MGICVQHLHYINSCFIDDDKVPAAVHTGHHRLEVLPEVGLLHKDFLVAGIADYTAHTGEDELRHDHTPPYVEVVLEVPAEESLLLVPLVMCVHLFQPNRPHDQCCPVCYPVRGLLGSGDRRICADC